MPYRKTIFVNNEIYHIFNRGANHQPIFFTKRDYKRNILTMKYYHHLHLPVKLSRFLVFSNETRNDIFKKLEKAKKLVSIYSYCLMPNHFHFLLKQNEENGISKFLANYQNSYTKYINKKLERDGPILKGRFNGSLIQTDEQFLHISRYIHLNPYTSYIVKTQNDLINYPWSSFNFYLINKKSFVDIKFIMSNFKSRQRYKNFVLNQADYQRSLEKIKHLTFD